jgi:hypothetical protein
MSSSITVASETATALLPWKSTINEITITCAMSCNVPAHDSTHHSRDWKLCLAVCVRVYMCVGGGEVCVCVLVVKVTRVQDLIINTSVVISKLTK